ncbi:MAG: carboxypeptidase regulatory-like domain-containing protein [Gemmataceae bacterium]|nr:carboxypeptidase regulatory-like domain-containing protein [Gemmataceae bacterium]
MKKDRLFRFSLEGAFFLALVGLVAGCGQRTGSVAGKVTFKGMPLASATVTFFDSAGNVRYGVTGESGEYSIAEVVTGKAKIIVGMPVEISMITPAERAGKEKPPTKSKYPALPERYLDQEKSGLSLEVQGGSQTFDLKLDQ